MATTYKYVLVINEFGQIKIDALRAFNDRGLFKSFKHGNSNWITFWCTFVGTIFPTWRRDRRRFLKVVNSQYDIGN